MGNPTKQAGGNVVFSHHSVTFTSIGDVTESTGVIAETPMDRSVILHDGFLGGSIHEDDSNGNGFVRGCALRQVNDTNVGLWVTNEHNGNVDALTLKFAMMTFPASAIRHLVHYIGTPAAGDTNQGWGELELTLTQPVTDPTKASVFGAVIGGSHFPMNPDGSSGGMMGMLYIDPADLNKVKLWYQTEATPAENLRVYFSVLELK